MLHEAQETILMLRLGQLVAPARQLVMIVGWLMTAEGQLVVIAEHLLLVEGHFVGSAPVDRLLRVVGGQLADHLALLK